MGERRRGARTAGKLPANNRKFVRVGIVDELRGMGWWCENRAVAAGSSGAQGVRCYRENVRCWVRRVENALMWCRSFISYVSLICFICVAHFVIAGGIGRRDTVLQGERALLSAPS